MRRRDPRVSNRASRFPRKTVRRIFAGSGIFGTSADFDRLTAINGRRSGRRPSLGDPGGGLGRLTFSIPVPFPAVAALPAAYKRAADARPTLPTSHNCRDTSPSCRPLSSSSIAEKLPAGHAPDHTPILRPVRLVERRAWSSGAAAGGLVKRPGGRLRRAGGGPSVPIREDRRRGGRLFGGQVGAMGRRPGPVFSVGKIGRPAGGSGGPCRSRLGSCQARRC